MSQHYKNPTQRIGLEQSGPHHHLIENQPLLAEKLQKSLTHLVIVMYLLFLF